MRAGSTECLMAVTPAINVFLVLQILQGFIGLGSVSEHLAHHVECLLAIVKVGGIGSPPNSLIGNFEKSKHLARHLK
jgi:uncharacterized membrane protein